MSILFSNVVFGKTLGATVIRNFSSLPIVTSSLTSTLSLTDVANLSQDRLAIPSRKRKAYSLFTIDVLANFTILLRFMLNYKLTVINLP